MPPFRFHHHFYDKDWRHGFVTVPLGDKDEARLEWSIFQPSPMVGFRFERGSDGLHLAVGLPWFALYPSLEGMHIWRSHDEREVQLQWHDGSVWFTPWGKSNESNRRDPWWVHGVTFYPMDFIFGSEKYAVEDLDQQEVVIPMPETSYPGTAKKTKATWKRPRAWWTRTRISWWIDIPSGVPAPGKWGDDDGIFGTGADGHDVEDAIGRVVSATLKMRARHGSGHLDIGKRATA